MEAHSQPLQSPSPLPPSASPDEIRRVLDELFPVHHFGEAVIELRALHVSRRGTVSGYFDDRDRLAKEAARLSGQCPGVYVTLNPVDATLLARAANRAAPFAKHTSSDSDIVRRITLPVDFDPVRPAGISSTDEEHAAALDRARACREYLRGRGWSEPVFADSGNGAHLLYRIDLPNDDESRSTVAGALRSLADRFDDDVVRVDQKTGNAARIWKLYGTLAAKGDPTVDRPHRMARILEVGDRAW